MVKREVRALIAIATGLACTLPGTLLAQRTTADGHAVVSLEPFVGAMRDTYDVSVDGNGIGGMLGVRAAYGAMPSLRLIGDFAYTRAYDVAPQTDPPYFIYDIQWLFATAGAELVKSRGRTTIGIGAEFGVGWNRTIHDGRVGVPADDLSFNNDWSTVGVAVGSASVHYQIVRRAALAAGARVYSFERGQRLSPAITLGVSLR